VRESKEESGWGGKRERERQAEREEEPGRVVPACSISLIVVMTTAGVELEDTLINRL